MQQLLDTLKTCKSALLGIYSARTGLSDDRLGKMMRDETWLNASDALKFGFVDETISGGKPSQGASAVALQNYVNVPAALLAARSETTCPEPVENVESADARRLRDEAKIYKGA